MDRNPFGIEGMLDPLTGWFLIRIRELLPQPPELELIFSDYIHNLRAVLDQIAYSLTPNAGERTYFPVVREAKDWRSQHMGQIPDFPSEWLGKVEDAQPFQYGSNYKAHPLYMLHHLDIQEKHRHLVPLGLSYFAWEPTFAFNRIYRPDHGEYVVDEQADRDIEVVDGTVIWRVRAVSKKDDLRITDILNVQNVKFDIGVISPLTRDYGHTLPNFEAFVGTVLEWLAPAF